MGFNTSMIVLNDALSYIEKDVEFGLKVSRAISKLSMPPKYRPSYGIDVSACNYVNAATVIESHHADMTSIVAFGQNRAIHLNTAWVHSHAQRDESEEVSILKALADKLGYQVRRKPTPQNDL